MTEKVSTEKKIRNIRRQTRKKYSAEENLGVVVMGNDSTIDRESLADVLANMEW